LWRHRAAWAPTWAGIGVFTVAGLLAVTAPTARLLFAGPAGGVPAPGRVTRCDRAGGRGRGAVVV
ncbi:hypothetical protein ACFV4M_05165, partial [Kitasatospora indigofera]|uniref:hypothetical protein n=1 Tax=Kitasatospora indigofera TaxID=67307 RepID=UPI00364D96E0